jgi:DHA1 family inner membrane transport protein
MVDASNQTKATHSTSTNEKLTLATLFLTSFATQPPGIITGLLLIDISKTYEVPIGVAGQIRTLSPIVSTVVGLLLAVLALKYSQKTLLLTGLAFTAASSIGCTYAPDFTWLLIIYSLSGFGSAIVTPMGQSIIGETFKPEGRAGAIAWTSASISFAYVIGAPLIGFLSGLGGWSLTFIAFSFPISLIAILVASIVLITPKKRETNPGTKIKYFEGIYGVLSNKSACACLVGNILSMAAWTTMLLYTASFIRQSFGLSTSFASVYILIAAALYTAGSLASGSFVNRVGRKRVYVAATIIAGVFLLMHYNLSWFWLSAAAGCVTCFFFGIRLTASNNLSLEQIPSFRGSMMSLNSMTGNIGSAVGAGLGGLILILYSYGGLGTLFCVISFIAVAVIQLFAWDPLVHIDQSKYTRESS